MRVWSRVTLVRFSPRTIFLPDILQFTIVSLNGINQKPKKAKTSWKLNLQEFCESTVSPNLKKPNTIGIISPDQDRMLLHFFWTSATPFSGNAWASVSAVSQLLLACLELAWNWRLFCANPQLSAFLFFVRINQKRIFGVFGIEHRFDGLLLETLFPQFFPVSGVTLH